jgi:hypothetical protein
MTLERMREIFGVMHATDVKRMHFEEEEVLAPQGLPAAVPPEEGHAMRTRGLVVMVDDEGPVSPLVFSSPFLFFSETQDIFPPFLSLDRFVE